jgi:hypothetical protein
LHHEQRLQSLGSSYPELRLLTNYNVTGDKVHNFS